MARYDRDWRGDRAPGWGMNRDHVRHGRYGGDYRRRGYGRDYAAGGGYGYDYGRSTGVGYGFYGPGWSPYAAVPGAWDPTLGWAGLPPPPEYAGWMMGAAPPRWEEEPRRMSPRESPEYGAGGDRALRRWAERYGYDFEYTIRPRPGRGPRR